MPVRRLKSHLNIVTGGHNLITWRPLGTYAARERLGDPLTTLGMEKGGEDPPREGRHSQCQRKEG